jgi:hypothetical protein
MSSPPLASPRLLRRNLSLWEPKGKGALLEEIRRGVGEEVQVEEK